MSNQLDNYINLEEAATYLGVKPATIRMIKSYIILNKMSSSI